MLRKESKEHKDGLLIRFGDIHTHIFEGEILKYVIVNTGEKNYFYAAPVIERGGKRLICMPGTGGIEDIDEIIGNMTLKEIEEGMKNYFNESGLKIPDIFINMLSEYSHTQPRVLTN